MATEGVISVDGDSPKEELSKNQQANTVESENKKRIRTYTGKKTS